MSERPASLRTVQRLYFGMYGSHSFFFLSQTVGYTLVDRACCDLVRASELKHTVECYHAMTSDIVIQTQDQLCLQSSSVSI